MHSRLDRSALLFAVSAAGIMVLANCARHSDHLALGQELAVPAGLDSAQTRAWIAQQERRCPGRLIRLSDFGVFAVLCQDSAVAHRPPKER